MRIKKSAIAKQLRKIADDIEASHNKEYLAVVSIEGNTAVPLIAEIESMTDGLSYDCKLRFAPLNDDIYEGNNEKS